MQSLLYVEYLTKTHGEKSIGKMLAAFAEGLDTGPALEKACNVKKADFEKGLSRVSRREGQEHARSPRPQGDDAQATAQGECKNPDDLDIAAQLAEKNYDLAKKHDAKELSENILKKDPKNTTAVYIKARFLLDEGSNDLAISILEKIAKGDHHRHQAAQTAGVVAIQCQELPAGGAGVRKRAQDRSK